MSLSDFHLIWLKIITALTKPFAGSANENQVTSLQFTARESLKNLLLVSKADGMFATISERTNNDLWEMTFAVVENLAPGIKDDIAASLNLPNIDAESPNNKGVEANQTTKQTDSLAVQSKNCDQDTHLNESIPLEPQ